MTLFVGTRDGVYRTTSETLDTFERVLDSGDTLRVRTFENHDGVFSASKSGLYRSLDDGTTWENLDVPRQEVFSVRGSPDGARLYVGTHPAHLYVSTDHGDSWRELESFQTLPSRNNWHTPRHRNAAHVRSIGAHPDAPRRVVTGVEVGGVYVSDDNGETWTERRTNSNSEINLRDDVHHVLVLGADTYVVSCGEGLYRTRDVGRSWTRLDDKNVHTYFREAFYHQGILYAGAHTRPGTWNTGAGTVLLEYHEDSEAKVEMSFPGERDNELVVAWTTMNGRVLGGTNAGQILLRGDDGWVSMGYLPARIRSLEGDSTVFDD